MVHIIPLFTDQRRPRDAAPDAAPAGPLDPYWQEVADHYARRMARQQAFDTEIAARRLDGEIASAEADVAANAPADGEGLHHAMYGEVDRHTGRVVLKGRFDTLFDNFLKQAPPELRAGLASRKPALREAGSVRMAMQQLQRRTQYEQDHLAAAQAEELDAIARSDPDDHAAFDAARHAGLDLIAKMNLDPESRLQAEADWRENTARTRIEALIARDPGRATEVLSGGTVAGSRQADDPATDPRTDLSADGIRQLLRQARAATVSQLIQTRSGIDLASQNAPDEIANTGSYSGAMPSPADFAAVYGVEEGGKRYQDFGRKIDAGRQAFGMRTMPNQAIHAALRDVEPGPGSSKEDQARYQVTAAAALKILGDRRADPAGYVREVFPDVDAAWGEVTGLAGKPGINDREAYRPAIAVSVAAQRQLGVDNPQPLPKAVVLSIAHGFSQRDLPQAHRDIVLSDLLAAAPDRETREALAKQLGQADVYQPTEIDPITTAATGQQPPPSAPLGEPLPAPQAAAEDLGEPAEAGELNPGSPTKKGSVKKTGNPIFDQILEDDRVASRLVRLSSHPTTAEVDDIPRKLNLNPAGPDQNKIFWFDTFNGLRAYLMGNASFKSHPGHNNSEDALRHAEWSAKMAQTLGVDEAKKISDAYEISHPNDRYERAMDLINNNVGRVLGEALPGIAPEEIARLALAAGLLQASPPPAMIYREKKK